MVFKLVTMNDPGGVLMSIMLIANITLMILLPCYYGSELEKASENLLIAIYQSDWLNCELNTKKLMVTFMENVKEPLKINCYLMFDVNMELFAKILDSSYSLYCVLASLNDLKNLKISRIMYKK